MESTQSNVLLRIVLRDLDRTLKDAEANELRDRIYAACTKGPYIRGPQVRRGRRAHAKRLQCEHRSHLRRLPLRAQLFLGWSPVYFGRLKL